MQILEARKRGFVRGVAVEVFGQFRIMTSNRIVQIGDNLMAMGNSPFWLFYKNEWVAKIIKTKNERTNENYESIN